MALYSNPYKNYMTNQRGSTKWKHQGYVKREKKMPGKTKSRKIVLMHGLFSSPKKFQAYENSLKAKGYQVVTLKHNMPLKPTDHLKVRKFLDQHRDADHFIGHSYGGMAIASHPGIPSNKIITLNSPFARKD
jgi:pimeloyl-ACP methyl ester carboxylesterase